MKKKGTLSLVRFVCSFPGQRQSKSKIRKNPSSISIFALFFTGVKAVLFIQSPFPQLVFLIFNKSLCLVSFPYLNRNEIHLKLVFCIISKKENITGVHFISDVEVMKL